MDTKEKEKIKIYKGTRYAVRKDGSLIVMNGFPALRVTSILARPDIAELKVNMLLKDMAKKVQKSKEPNGRAISSIKLSTTEILSYSTFNNGVDTNMKTAIEQEYRQKLISDGHLPADFGNKSFSLPPAETNPDIVNTGDTAPGPAANPVYEDLTGFTDEGEKITFAPEVIDEEDIPRECHGKSRDAIRKLTIEKFGVSATGVSRDSVIKSYIQIKKEHEAKIAAPKTAEKTTTGKK